MNISLKLFGWPLWIGFNPEISCALLLFIGQFDDFEACQTCCACS